MDGVFTPCAGLDVYKKSLTACRIVPDPTGHDGEGVAARQVFGTMTIALLAFVDWLTAAGMTHVAMESTGADWKPVYNLLEGSVTGLLVHAAASADMMGVSGRAMLDALLAGRADPQAMAA